MSCSRIFVFLFVLLIASPALAQGKTIIVLDASGSMWGQIGGTTKIEIARETLGQVMTTIPQETDLGLIAYGHREKGACSDIELAVPPAAGTASAITAFANGLNPKGKTPLTDAVRMAAGELAIEENKATVILVTDGLETCNADPCALGRELEAAGVDFTAHVVGFGLSDDEGRQVACLAENTGGLYLKADDAGQLADALATTVAAAPEPEPEPVAVEFNINAMAKLAEDGPVLEGNQSVRWDFFPIDASGKPARQDAAGGYGGVFRATVPAGKYLARARLGRLSKEYEVELADDATTDVTAVLDAGLVRMIPKRTPDDTEADSNARVDAHFEGGKDGGYGATEVYAAAGPVTVTGKIGKAVAEQSFTLAPGETVEKVLVIGSGLVVPAAVYAEGGPAVEGSAIRFDVMAAEPDINGKRAQIAGQYGPGNSGTNVPAGEYMLVARLGEAQAMVPITVKAGERTEATVNIDAGVLAVSAPGAYRIDFLEAKKDIQGKQRKITGTYGEAVQDTFHPGEYEILVTYEGGEPEKRQTATVKAGERTEVTVE